MTFIYIGIHGIHKSIKKIDISILTDYKTMKIGIHLGIHFY
mgnify:CR=1 FL=1